MDNNDYENLWKDVEKTNFYKEHIENKKHAEYLTQAEFDERELKKKIKERKSKNINSIIFPIVTFFTKRKARFNTLTYIDVKFEILKGLFVSLIVYSIIGFIFKLLLSITLFKWVPTSIGRFYQDVGALNSDTSFTDPFYITNILYKLSHGSGSLCFFYLFILTLLFLDIIRYLKLEEPIYKTFLGSSFLAGIINSIKTTDVFEKRYYASITDRVLHQMGYNFNYVSVQHKSPFVMSLYSVLALGLVGPLILPLLIYFIILRFFLFGHFIYAIGFLFVYRKG